MKDQHGTLRSQKDDDRIHIRELDFRGYKWDGTGSTSCPITCSGVSNVNLQVQ
jgi:hypothetical protein